MSDTSENPPASLAARHANVIAENLRRIDAALPLVPMPRSRVSDDSRPDAPAQPALPQVADPQSVTSLPVDPPQPTPTPKLLKPHGRVRS